MNIQVELFHTSLSLISIPLDAYPFFCQGIIRLALGTWKEDLRKRESLKTNENPSPSPAPGGISSETSDGINARAGNVSEGGIRSNSTGDIIDEINTTTKRTSVIRLEDNSNSNISTPTSSSPLPPDIDDLCDLLEDFINISFTPIECSVICPSELVYLLFGEGLTTLGTSMGVQVLKEEYVAIKVDSDGQDTGLSVLKMSYPLSAAGIPIFFIATYFSDYVLIPVREKHRVIKTLESQNFIFSDIANSYISISNEDPKSPALIPRSADNTNNNDNNDNDQGDQGDPFSSPSSTIALKTKTLSLFEKHGVNPLIDNTVKLLLTGARASSRESNDEIYLSIVRILISPPKFFSLTVISGSEISFLIDNETAGCFPSHMLLGSPTDFVLPVSFDLRNLPQDSTGIVSGLASIFANVEESSENTVHMRYLSTALASVLLISEDDFENAMNSFPKLE